MVRVLTVVLTAILAAWHAVRTGEVDCALVGAADYAATPSTLVYLRQSGRILEIREELRLEKALDFIVGVRDEEEKKD